MLDFLLDIAKPLWAPILAGLGLVVAVFGAYLKGRSEQATKGKIAAQKETINADKTRVETDQSIASATPTERERLRGKWTTRDN